MKTNCSSLHSDFQKSAICVLIPTYNNDTTLAQVIDSVLAYTDQVVIINDGSTDQTEEVLKKYNHLPIISYALNQGKGYALKLGFRKAWSLGYHYAITIDSDGQHFASDLPIFIETIKEHPHTIIIGSRDMDQEHVPGKSNFGNKFSNFWFWVETGEKLPDTQSGYRVYPLEKASQMKYFTKKYEFEIEAPIRLIWSGIPIHSVPIKVFYPPADERISHFRPFKDFMRISVLNTFLTFIAITWIHPRNFTRKISKKQGRNDLYRKVFFDPQETLNIKAKSLGFGVFMGILPIWGFQLAIGIPLAIYFKMNKALFLIAANVSIFPITPIIWAMSLFTGKIILGYNDWSLKFEDLSLEQFKEAGLAFFLGGTVLAVASGLLTYLFGVLFFKRKKDLT